MAMDFGVPARSSRGGRARLRESKLLILVELAAVAAIFVADQPGLHLIWFSKTLYLLGLGGASLLVRGMGWRDLGLRISRNWGLLVFFGLVAGILMEGLELFVTQPWLQQLTGQGPDLSAVDGLVGNPAQFGLGLALVWTLAAFGEELVWRAWLLNRLTDLVGRRWWGWTISLLAVSAVFGLAHLYQGVTGVAENAIGGLLLGLVYLASGRNLWAAIIAHGVTDSVDLTLMFTGHYPPC